MFTINLYGQVITSIQGAVKAWMSNYVSLFYVHVVTYSYPNIDPGLDHH